MQHEQHSQLPAGERQQDRDFGSLQNQVVVVTGSSSGIGRAIALECAAAGASVVVHSAHNESGAKNVLQELKSISTKRGITASHVALKADFGTEQACEDFVQQVAKTAGPVDAWVNNAGADLLTGDGAQLDYVAKLERLFAIDVRATLLLSKAIGAEMRTAGKGAILNIGWDQADRGMEGDSGELFSASKNAIMGFTRSLAVSLAPEVRVNCIAPGWILTAWGETASDVWQARVKRETPLARWGLPSDIAKLARFLLSRDAAYLTGQVINCNGGAVR